MTKHEDRSGSLVTLLLLMTCTTSSTGREEYIIVLTTDEAVPLRQGDAMLVDPAVLEEAPEPQAGE